MARTIRADHIGSLLRPARLLRARDDLAEGRIDAAGLRAVEDDAIREVVALQEATGIGVITDGEFRRGTYSESFTTSGIAGISVALTEAEGWRLSETHGHRMARRIPKVVGRIEWRGPRNAEDFAFLRSLTGRVAKMTLPGPAYIHYRAGRANISREIYPDLDSFWADLVAAYRKEIASLAAAGCAYLQIDETSLIKLGDPRARTLLAERGDDWRDLLRLYIQAINGAISEAPEDMTIGLHVCRSQDPSWQADTGYDPIAEAMFNDIAIDRFLLEYDNPRAGTFEPLRLLPRGKAAILGLVSTHRAEVETTAFLERRIEEASRYAPLDRLGLSPQCGFSTSADQPDAVDIAVERRKLARIVEVARAVWGEA